MSIINPFRKNSVMVKEENSSATTTSSKHPYLYINVKEAQGLEFSSTGKIYCEIKSNNVSICTSTVKAKANPKWREEFLIQMKPPLPLEIEVWFQPSSTTGKKRGQGKILPWKTNPKEKSERVLIGVTSLSITSAHEEGQLIEDWFRIRENEAGFTDLPMDDKMGFTSRPTSANHEILRSMTPGSPKLGSAPSSPKIGGVSYTEKSRGTSRGKIYLVIQFFKSKQVASMTYQSVLEKMQQPKYQRFVKVLVNEDQLDTVSCLCDIMDPSDVDKVAPPLVRLFDFHEKIRVLWRHLIRDEVQSSESSAVLFRSNSMAIKIVSIYAKMCGLNYLHKVLGPILKEVVQLTDPEEYELDPLKLGLSNNSSNNSSNRSTGTIRVSSLHGLSLESQNVMERNAKKMKKIVSSAIEAIFNSVYEFPEVLLAICSDIVEVVSAKFPTFKYQAISSFISLRFFNPAIITPESFHFPDTNPSAEHRRVLVLTAKVVQCIFNGSTFTPKEDYMQVMNGFVQLNIAQAQTFMSKISAPYLGKLPTPTITQAINQSAFSRASKDMNMTISKSGMVNFSAVNMNMSVFGRQADILSDVKTIHGYLTKYYPKIVKANMEDEDLDIPLDQMKASIDEMQEVAAVKKLDPLPFADYMAPLSDKGAIKIDSESSFDQHWVQQQQAQSLYSGEDDTDILNDQEWMSIDPKRDFCDIISDILKDMLNIYVKYEGKWSAIRKSEDYSKLKLASCELRSITFDQESPHPSLLTFWINAYNCLMIHIHIHVGPPTNKVLRKIFFRDFCYMIGDHKFSLRDIRDGILRANPKGKISRHRLIRSFDPRRSLVLSHFDPRVHFALSLLNHATPIVRLYSPSTIEEQLQFSGEAFMNKHIQIGFGSLNRGKEEMGSNAEVPLVTLPVIIEKNASDFGLKLNNKESQHQLFIWLFQFLSTKKRLDLMMVLESKDFLINFEENTWETMNVRQSIRLTKKNINNLIHEAQTTFRCICLDILHVETVEDILSIGKAVHSISSRLRDCKDSYLEIIGKAMHTSLTRKFSVVNNNKDRHFLNFVALSKEQKLKVPENKHAIFLDITKKILVEVEGIIANLSIFILENGFGENTDLLVQLNVIAREARVLDERLHSMPSFAQKEVPSAHKNIFMLIQATSSEMGDVSNVIKILDKEISEFVFEEPSAGIPALIGRRANSVGEIRKSSLIGGARLKRDPKLTVAKEERKWALQSILDKQTLLLTIGVIMRYIKGQLEVDTKKTDMLPPFEPQSVTTEGLYSTDKLRELQAAIGHSFRIIYSQIDSFLEQLSTENSTKQILLLATKARNIRNALRHLKGKKLKLVMGNLAMLEGSDSRLTIRMINASANNRELDNELAEEDLQILERLLL